MKVVLSIAGSDSSGGAGIQADIKSAHYHGAYMATALSAITAQNTQGVSAAVFLEPSFVSAQIRAVLEDIKVDAIKIGMLGNAQIIKAVFEELENINIPIILDPVAISRAGSKLIDDNAIESLRSLFDLATLITPNRYEAKLFFGIENAQEIEKIQNPMTNIVFKNIVDDAQKSIDILLKKDGTQVHFETPKLNSSNTHGTGCSFSASIASLLAQDKTLQEAIKISKEYIYQAIKQAPNLGHGNGPINHMLKDENASRIKTRNT
jgi:hydroxymethylpyrimidine/phosphomethylpyrimidine kinase